MWSCGLCLDLAHCGLGLSLAVLVLFCEIGPYDLVTLVVAMIFKDTLFKCYL